jgi:preprotein translocase subunit SecF
MIDLLKYRYVYLVISAVIILPGLVFIGLGGLKLGIDFTGGTELTVLMPRNAHATVASVEAVVRAVPYRGHPGYLDDSQVQQVQVQGQANQQGYLIRTRDIGANVPVQKSLIAALKAKYGNVQTQGFQSVGGTIGAQTTTRAIQAVIVAAIAILLYMAFAFRKLTHPFVYGGAAIVALLHDVLVVLGLFAIMGYFFNVRVDALFVPAVLTVIGFSVHDTIVVFDRIRENMSRRTGEPYYTVVNNSLLQTLGRSLNTSLTVLLTLTALLLFGGSSIRVFVLALLIGITSGTYSSIFNATPLAVIWETGELPRLFGRGKKPESGRARTASARRPVGTLRS